MPLMITRKSAYEMKADMIICIRHQASSDATAKKNFLQQFIRKLQTTALGNSVCRICYTADFSAFEKDYEKALDRAIRYGYETVAVSCEDEVGAILARMFSKQFAEEKDLRIWLSLPQNVQISGCAIGRLKDLLFEDDEPVQILQPKEEDRCFSSLTLDEICIPVEQAYAAAMPDEEDDRDYGILEEDFAPPLMSPAPPLQAKDSKIQSERPESRKINASAPRESKAKSSSDFRNLKEFLKQNDAGFKDTLLKYIDCAGKKDSEVYKKANVDRRLFSKILNVQGYNPSKPTAIAFAIALELNLEETKDLIGRAGYTLSQASTFDRIIEFFILEENYDIYEINEALFYFDQSLLGC